MFLMFGHAGLQSFGLLFRSKTIARYFLSLAKNVRSNPLLHGTLTWVANLITEQFPEGNDLLHSLVPHSVVYELMSAAMTLSFRPFAVETKLSILSIFLFDQWKTRRCLTSW